MHKAYTDNGYKIYIPESKKFVANGNVTFMEKLFSTQGLAGQEPFSISIFDSFPMYNNYLYIYKYSLYIWLFW